jgi:hypothetical protein
MELLSLRRILLFTRAISRPGSCASSFASRGGFARGDWTHNSAELPPQSPQWQSRRSQRADPPASAHLEAPRGSPCAGPFILPAAAGQNGPQAATMRSCRGEAKALIYGSGRIGATVRALGRPSGSSRTPGASTAPAPARLSARRRNKRSPTILLKNTHPSAASATLNRSRSSTSSTSTPRTSRRGWRGPRSAASVFSD